MPWNGDDEVDVTTPLQRSTPDGPGGHPWGGGVPKCTLCGMQTNFASAPNHERTATCRAGVERREQHERAEEAARAMDETFTAYGVELEQVEVFKYLGRMIRNDDNDTQAIRVQIRKARGVWGRLSRVMRAENASPRVCGMFYKATVQAVLLFGSETWCLSPANLRLLEGFHVRAARRMTGMMPKRKSDGTWEYPDSVEVLKAACLHTVEDYITVRRRTVMKYVVERPIYQYCREAERQRGSGSHLFWWNQPMELEETSAEAEAQADVATADDLRPLGQRLRRARVVSVDGENQQVGPSGPWEQTM